MKYIAIIAAEDKEVLAIKEKMTDIIEDKIYNITFYTGKIKSVNCVLVKSGVGKVNSARTTQAIIDKFNPKFIINLGSAGALSDKLKIGDVVIGTNLIQHDFDVTAFGREKGFIPEVGKDFLSDTKLVEICEKYLKSKEISCTKGTIVSGDKFISTTSEKFDLGNEFNALCAEMEGASIAQVCKLCGIPFIVIRSISDELNGDAKVDFEEFLETASKKCANIIYGVIEKF